MHKEWNKRSWQIYHLIYRTDKFQKLGVVVFMYRNLLHLQNKQWLLEYSTHLSLFCLLVFPTMVSYKIKPTATSSCDEGHVGLVSPMKVYPTVYALSELQ